MFLKKGNYFKNLNQGKRNFKPRIYQIMIKEKRNQMLERIHCSQIKTNQFMKSSRIKFLLSVKTLSAFLLLKGKWKMMKDKKLLAGFRLLKTLRFLLLKRRTDSNWKKKAFKILYWWRNKFFPPKAPQLADLLKCRLWTIKT
jgi:hypothetical protein